MTKVLITGGAGCIGSHLVDRLATDGHEIIVYDNFSRGKPPSAAFLTDTRTRYVQGDIRDYDHLLNEIEGSEIVYHLAGQTSVIGAYVDLDYCLTTNIMGTYNTLKASKEAGVERVIYTSSREVYGECIKLPVNENTHLRYKNLYGETKAIGDRFCQLFNDEYQLPVVILRLTNVYGPHDFDRVIPNFIDQARKGDPLEVFGGKQIIDLVWIELVIEALIRSTTYAVTGIPINIGSGSGVSIMDLAQSIIQLSHSSSKIIIQPARSVEVNKYVADITRMNDMLHLQSNIKLLDGLCRIINNSDSLPRNGSD